MINKQFTSETAMRQKATKASTNTFRGWGSLAILLLILMMGVNAFAATTTTTALKVGLTSAPTVAVTTAPYGASVTLTATVTPSTAVGTVTFKVGTTALGSAVTVTSGTASMATSALALGANSLTAVFTPTSTINFTASTSSASTLTVAQATTATALKVGLTSAPTVAITTATYGASVTLTATVTPTAAAGTVTFKVGTTTLGSPVTVTSGSATLATTTLAVGANSLTAVFTPTTVANYAASTSSASTLTVSQATTTTALKVGLTSAPTVAITTAAYGASVTLTATTTPSSLAGTVTFKLGGVAIGSPVTVTSGSASLATTALVTGVNSLTAVFTPTNSTSYATSTSSASSVTVTAAATATSLSAALSASPSVAVTTASFGTSVTLTATITPGTLAGTVTFTAGGITIGTPVTVSSGTAALATSTLAIGADSLAAVFTPTDSTNYASSTSSAFTFTVTKAVSGTALSVSAGPYYYGNSVTLTATQTPSTATGSVGFFNGATQVGSCTLSSGTCNTTTAALPVASNTLTAVYAGDSTYATSTSSGSTVNVIATPTRVTLVSSLPTISPSASITLTATVTATAGSATISSGNVTFWDSSTNLGKVPVDSSGVATLAITSLATPGNHYLLALYDGAYSSGTAIFSISLSSSAKVVVSSDLAPTISHWYNNSTVYGTPLTFAATSNSDGAITYSVISGPGTINGATLTPTGVGVITVGLTQAAGTYYHAITDPTLWAKTIRVYQAPLLITASSPAVTYSAAVPTITPSYTTLVNGDTGTSLTAAPTCATTYTTSSHPGTYVTYCYGTTAPNYSVTYATGLVTVSKLTPTITAPPTPSQITYGGRLVTSTLTGGTASVAGAFAWTNGNTIARVGSSQGVTFTPTDRTDYNNATTNITVNELQATPTIVGQPIASSAAYNSALSTSRLTGGSANGIAGVIPGTYTWTTPTTTLTVMGANSESVTFTPADSTDYTTALGATNVTVIKATPVVSAWPTAAAITYGAALSTSTLTGGSATPSGGTFAWTTPSAVPTVGSPSVSVTYTPKVADATYYATVTGTIHITVNKLTATVNSWPTPSAITYGQTLASSRLSGGSANVGGTFAWTTPSTAPGAGSPAESVTFTPSNSSLYASLTGNVNVTVNKATPVVSTWPTASSVTLAQTLGNAILSGGSSTPSGGSFDWTSSSATLVPGTTSYGVTYTPADTADYNNVVGLVFVTVNPCGYQDSTNSAYSTAMFLFDANNTPTIDPSVDVEGTNLSAVCAVNAGTTDTTITPTVTYPFITSNATSTYPADSSAYGLNAAVLAYGTAATAGTGATITIVDDGSGGPGYISTANDNTSGVFASMGGTVNITDTLVSTSGDNAHGLAATYAGTLAITDVQVTTAGANSSAILTGVGGGTVTVNGGSYTTNGSTAAGISAAGTGSTITVTDTNTAGTTISAANGPAVVVEGANSVTVTSTVGTSLSGALGDDHGIYLYEGDSGDATAGTSSFTMTNGSISYNCDVNSTAACGTGSASSGQNNPATLFSVANTTATITLTDVTLNNDTPTTTNTNGTLLTAAALNTGTSGHNGGNVTFNAYGETLIGDVIVDSISTVALNLAADTASSPVPSTLTGAINNANSGAATVSLTLDATSSWVVTADSYLTSLTNAVAGNTNITCATSCTVYVNGSPITIGN